MTLRERDTTAQLIGPIDEVIAVIKALCDGELQWEGATKRLPAYSGKQAVE
jgi:glycyl-tRNA synthetase